VSRLNEKRTYFGCEAIRVVRRYFDAEKYKNHPGLIARYAQWAVRKDGPAIFETPTPIDCVVDKKSPGYIVSLRVITVLLCSRLPAPERYLLLVLHDRCIWALR
jgi:hypothetical protein